VTQFRPKSPIAEAYRTLATNIDLQRLKREGANEFVITSSSMQEGKSTTIANLAIAMAQLGHRTLVVECNLRRPTDYKIFGLDMGPGVRDISLGMVHWRQTVRNINDIALGKMSVTEELLRDGAWSRLNFVTCGAIYHNPSEILSTPKMAEFLREAKQEYDVVLIDCPPVLPVTDAAIIGSKVDGVILVYQVGKVARGALKRAKTHLEAVNAEVWGVVLNDFKAEISGFSPDTAYYGKYYGGDKDEFMKKSGFYKLISGLFTPSKGKKTKKSHLYEPEKDTLESASELAKSNVGNNLSEIYNKSQNIINSKS
jgi:capsular exopolysaccharide synthesis family protein